MPINEGLANLSHYAFVVTVVAYALAVLAFACDFAFGRHALGPLKPAQEPVADLVTVGSPQGAADPGMPGRPAGPGPDGRTVIDVGGLARSDAAGGFETEFAGLASEIAAAGQGSEPAVPARDPAPVPGAGTSGGAPAAGDPTEGE